MEADQYFEKIEAYLRGELSATEAEAFRAEVAESPELQARLLRHRLADRAAELAQDEYLREKMQTVRKQYGPLPKPETKVIGLRRWATRAAAVLLLIIGGSGGYAYLSHSDSALLHAYYQPAASPGTARGEAESDQWFAQGLYLYYQEKDYAAALQSFAAVEPGSEHETAAQYFIAHCQLQTGQPAAALTAFDQMLANGTVPAFAEREEIEWNRILCFLELDKDDRVREALQKIREGSSYSAEMKTRAANLERDLKSIWRKVIG